MRQDTTPKTKTGKEAFWAHHLEAVKKSTLTITDDCKRHGLSLAAYYYWKRRLESPTPPAAAASPLRLVPLPAPARQPEAPAPPIGGAAEELNGSKDRISIHVGPYRVETTSAVDAGHLERVLRAHAGMNRLLGVLAFCPRGVPRARAMR